jgi:hypothetical protein
VVLLVYLFLVENVLTNIPSLHGWTPYLPGQAEEALVGSTLTDQDLLAPWQGGLLLAAYGLVAAGTAAAPDTSPARASNRRGRSALPLRRLPAAVRRSR